MGRLGCPSGWGPDGRGLCMSWPALAVRTWSHDAVQRREVTFNVTFRMLLLLTLFMTHDTLGSYSHLDMNPMTAV